MLEHLDVWWKHTEESSVSKRHNLYYDLVLYGSIKVNLMHHFMTHSQTVQPRRDNV